MTNTAEPLVSIIVPVYNAEQYLKYCVDSILGQSHQNLEIILVDDGSTDSSAKLCDAYATLDQRVKVIHQENGGIGTAQNTGLDIAHGRYIAFADNDDILDRRNIELLLHALQTTGADMSKARWRQFGASQIEHIMSQAQEGAVDPEHISVFKNPLHAYQNVFCKSLRLLGTGLGLNTEAKYFNEANWCRLYTREVWENVRFPERMYAQDVMVAGKLYAQMNLVADIDVNLYNWLQSPQSVTHQERSFSFYHDNLRAGVHNFSYAIERGITPARSYYTMVGAVNEERTAGDATLPEYVHQNETDRIQLATLLQQLGWTQRVRCAVLRYLRLVEKHIYDRTIKNIR